MSGLDDFLEKAKSTRSKKCACCQNDELAAVIVDYLDKLKAGETRVTLGYLHRHYLASRFDRPRHVSSLRDHIHNCLRRDHRTGRSLDE